MPTFFRNLNDKVAIPYFKLSFSLDSAISQINSQTAPEGFWVNLRSYFYTGCLSVSDMKVLVKAIISGNAPKGLNIDLDAVAKAVDDTKACVLVEAIESGFAPEGLRIGLMGNDLTDVSGIAFAKAIGLGNAPKGLKLCLAFNPLKKASARAFAEAIRSGNAPEGLELDLRFNNKLNDGDIQLIARAVAYQNKFNNKKIIFKHGNSKIIEKAYQDLDDMTFELLSVNPAVKDILPRIVFYAWHPELGEFNQPTRYPDPKTKSWFGTIKKTMSNGYQNFEFKGPVHMITGYPASFFTTPYADFGDDHVESNQYQP